MLPKSACIKGLGYNLNAGKTGYVGGITPGRIKVYVHNLTVRIGEDRFQARVAFLKVMMSPTFGKS